MGGGEEHVESRVKSGHVVAASVSLVDVVGLVREEPLRQELHHLGNFDRDEFEGEKSEGLARFPTGWKRKEAGS